MDDGFMKKRIAVIGCGWLGLPLAEQLVAHGHQVYGTTTSEAKTGTIAGAGIVPVLLKVGMDGLVCSDQALWRADAYIIAIPPGVRAHGEDHHVGQVNVLLQHLPEHAPIIYVSSTSVYPSEADSYDESYPVEISTTGNTTLYRAEQLITGHGQWTILRSGGLMGRDRVSGRYFAGKAAGGRQQPVNYIHQSDAIGLISGVLDKGLLGLYNLVCPEHPTRHEVYMANSMRHGFEMPHFTDDGLQRIIDGSLLPSKLEYTFRYPDPRGFD